MIVITRNEDDFRRFADITVENWFLPDAHQEGHDKEEHEQHNTNVSSLEEPLPGDESMTKRKDETCNALSGERPKNALPNYLRIRWLQISSNQPDLTYQWSISLKRYAQNQ
jgi:hypothetical protein